MNKQFDIIILTDKRYVKPKNIDTYTQNTLDEDNYVQKALENLGLKVTRLAWDDQILTGVLQNIFYSDQPGIILIGFRSFPFGWKKLVN